MSENNDRSYADMTVEELERKLRETFFYTDKIDETVYRELENLRAALEAKEPTEYRQEQARGNHSRLPLPHHLLSLSEWPHPLIRNSSERPET